MGCTACRGCHVEIVYGPRLAGILWPAVAGGAFSAFFYFQATQYYSMPCLAEYILHVFFVVTAFLTILFYAAQRSRIHFAKARKK